MHCNINIKNYVFLFLKFWKGNKKKMWGGEKNQKFGIIYTPACFFGLNCLGKIQLIFYILVGLEASFCMVLVVHVSQKAFGKFYFNSPFRSIFDLIWYRNLSFYKIFCILNLDGYCSYNLLFLQQSLCNQSKFSVYFHPSA